MYRSLVASLAVMSALCVVGFQGTPAVQAQAAHAASAAGKETGNAHMGEQVFLQKCFQCHSIVEGEVRFGPSLYHELKKPKPKKTEAEVRLIIKNGKNKMPAWGAILTQEDTDNILAYLRSL